MPIDDIDGKSHKMELNSTHNYSTNHFQVKITPLVIYGLGGRHTYINTRIHASMKVISRNQVDCQTEKLYLLVPIQLFAYFVLIASYAFV